MLAGTVLMNLQARPGNKSDGVLLYATAQLTPSDGVFRGMLGRASPAIPITKNRTRPPDDTCSRCCTGPLEG